MNIKQLEYIVALAEKRNLSDAADACFISQSALTQSLSKLEQKLGTQLFTRRRNEWTPTAAGARYLDAAVQILAIYNRTLKEIEALNMRSRKTIVLGVSSERASMIFPLIYPRFVKSFPDISIKLVEGNYPQLQQLIIEGGADLSLATMPLHVSKDVKHSFDYAQVYVEELSLIVPPGHRLAATVRENPSSAIELAQLSGETFVCHSKQRVLRQIFNEAILQHGIRPQELFEVSTNHAIVEFVGKGIGIAFVPGMFVRNDPSVCIVPTVPALACDLQVFFCKGRKLTLPESSLIRLLTEAFEIL